MPRLGTLSIGNINALGLSIDPTAGAVLPGGFSNVAGQSCLDDTGNIIDCGSPLATYQGPTPCLDSTGAVIACNAPGAVYKTGTTSPTASTPTNLNWVLLAVVIGGLVFMGGKR